MNTNKIVLALVILLFPFSTFVFPQVTPKENKISVSLNSGGFWASHNYGFGTSYYNINL